ncbi:MAG: hypothetical protein V4714_12710 [Bacteroidota bacterium]
MRYQLFLLWIVVVTGCHSSSKFDWVASRHFKAEAWQQDKLGCLGQRDKLKQAFEAIRRDLRGSSQDEIIELLGKPDIQKLQTRHQKFFVYYLENGSQCQNPEASSQARTVVIRFNAIGYASEITYSQGRP